MPRSSPLRPIWVTACPHSRSSGSPRRPYRRAVNGSGPPLPTPISSFLRDGSPSTWLRPTCQRREAASTCRSPSASSPQAARLRGRNCRGTNSSANSRFPANFARSRASCRQPWLQRETGTASPCRPPMPVNRHVCRTCGFWPSPACCSSASTSTEHGQRFPGIRRPSLLQQRIACRTCAMSSDRSRRNAPC